MVQLFGGQRWTTILSSVSPLTAWRCLASQWDSLWPQILPGLKALVRPGLGWSKPGNAYDNSSPMFTIFTFVQANQPVHHSPVHVHLWCRVCCGFPKPLGIPPKPWSALIFKPVVGHHLVRHDPHRHLLLPHSGQDP